MGCTESRKNHLDSNGFERYSHIACPLSVASEDSLILFAKTGHPKNLLTCLPGAFLSNDYASMKRGFGADASISWTRSSR